MGSLISKPKAPPAPAPVIITKPAPMPAEENESRTEEDVQATADKAAQEPESGEKDSSEQKKRSSNLLRRSRGKGGTILTSFRGVLNDRLKNQPRKTLLGE